MTRPTLAILVVSLVVASFSAGIWYSRRSVPAEPAQSGRRILYYVDPMHPAYKSDKPGIAPDCGMQLEPVYAGGANADAVQIDPATQQLMGVRLGKVEKISVTQSIRASGRVAVDETRIYRLLAGTEGWIREVFSNSTGSLVKKDEPLATFYSRYLLSIQQGLLYALNAQERMRGNTAPPDAQSASVAEQVRTARVTLESLGMSPTQIEEIVKTRKPAEDVILRAPAGCIILARNVSPNQRFDRGAEFYKLADVSRVWILADVFGAEAEYLPAGTVARVSLPGKPRVYQATVGTVLPQFDPVSRTLKVRLEADSGGYALRPDMLVDVEFPVRMPAAIAVPSDAIVDSGLKKTVFVSQGNGFFEPRQVEAGWQFGGYTQILKGLTAGETIVLSGNFLLDSESRMRQAGKRGPE